MILNHYHMPSESARQMPDFYVSHKPSEAHAIHVPEDVYRELAEQIRVECEYADQEYPKVAVECERGDVLYTAVTEMSLYFKQYKELWGMSTYLHSMAPCWTDFHAYNGDGDEIATDFNLSKFHQLLRLNF